eukprot:CAMPEP_0171781776 /NCGR_PEP_ID=MMETSP0991-20121206/60442_1 /TAXON_ID=483369 /ORGANISM="non described non described, Strain CCMP2098" /LENGTH=122 /DNA_ID=CAMNT_0012389473 /DNA_START=58 /DNA_END=423 /DNA_ORIENTATION=+
MHQVPPRSNSITSDEDDDNRSTGSSRHSVRSSLGELQAHAILNQAVGETRAAVALDKDGPGGNYRGALEMYKRAIASFGRAELEEGSPAHKAIEQRVSGYLKRVEHIEGHLSTVDGKDLGAA